MVPRLSQRLLGSPTQFNHSNRPATSSVNFLAAHDGFTLWDTVSFNDKHNDANGENGADGHSNNLSHNLGAEGSTDDPAINAARVRRVKAMLATLLLSQGVPMLLAGDEFGQGQNGNNNGYAQDNETTWLDWGAARSDLIDAVTTLTKFRKAVGLAGARFPHGEDVEEQGAPVVQWYHPAGRPMGEDDWKDAGLQCLAFEMSLPDQRRILACLNAGDDAEFILPEGDWRLHIDTARDTISCDEAVSGTTTLGWQSVSVFVS
jgi:isoamylase